MLKDMPASKAASTPYRVDSPPGRDLPPQDRADFAQRTPAAHAGFVGIRKVGHCRCSAPFRTSICLHWLCGASCPYRPRSLFGVLRPYCGVVGKGRKGSNGRACFRERSVLARPTSSGFNRILADTGRSCWTPALSAMDECAESHQTRSVSVMAGNPRVRIVRAFIVLQRLRRRGAFPSRSCRSSRIFGGRLRPSHRRGQSRNRSPSSSPAHRATRHKH
jgi:hypothetical protein